MKINNLWTSIVIVVGTILSTFGVELTTQAGLDLVTAIQTKNFFQIATALFAIYNVVRHIQKPTDGNYLGFFTSVNFWAQIWAVLVNLFSAFGTINLTTEEIGTIVTVIQSKDIWQMLAVIVPIVSKVLASVFKKDTSQVEPQA